MSNSLNKILKFSLSKELGTEQNIQSENTETMQSNEMVLISGLKTISSNQLSFNKFVIKF